LIKPPNITVNLLDSMWRLAALRRLPVLEAQTAAHSKQRTALLIGHARKQRFEARQGFD
jgi:hypothetical protein